MIQERIHDQIVKNLPAVEKWFEEQRSQVSFPFYGSFDLRDSQWKVAPVDANLFPAGFNNICQVDKEQSVELVERYLKSYYSEVKNIALITEEHTGNAYYWENVYTLLQLIEQAGFSVKATLFKDLDEAFTVTSSGGHQVNVFPSKRQGGQLLVAGEAVDLIVCNNDFSQEYSSWVDGLKTPMNPSYQMGWHRRKKDKFFLQYNQLTEEFCDLIDLPCSHLKVKTESFSGFDINSESSRKELAEKVDEFLSLLKEEYKEQKIPYEPFAFIKNNSGTYGLGILQAQSGEEILNWNYKSKKKMKAVKGGGSITEVIIQEGIPSSVQIEDSVAEPAIYMLGCQLAGGFLRMHNKKGPKDNLNSPGAVYKRLCVSDLKINVQGSPMENVYGWVSRLGFLSLAYETKVAGISYTNT